MDEEDEREDAMLRIEAKRASDVMDELRYNHLIETVDNDAKPQGIYHSCYHYHYHYHYYNHYHYYHHCL